MFDDFQWLDFGRSCKSRNSWTLKRKKERRILWKNCFRYFFLSDFFSFLSDFCCLLISFSIDFVADVEFSVRAAVGLFTGFPIFLVWFLPFLVRFLLFLDFLFHRWNICNGWNGGRVGRRLRRWGIGQDAQFVGIVPPAQPILFAHCTSHLRLVCCWVHIGILTASIFGTIIASNGVQASEAIGVKFPACGSVLSNRAEISGEN